MIEFNEFLLKENLFEYLVKNSKSSNYKKALQIFNNEKLEQDSFLKKEENKLKIFTKIVNHGIDTTCYIDLKNFEFDSKCSECKNDLCEHVIASCLYFLENFKFDYSVQKISLRNLIKRSEEAERIKGYVIKGDELIPGLIGIIEGKYQIKKYLKESEFEKFDASTVEFIINYQEENYHSPKFFIQSRGKTVIPLEIVNDYCKLIIQLERISDKELKIKGKIDGNVAFILKGFFKRYVIFKDGKVKTFPRDLELSVVERLLEGEGVISTDDLNFVIYSEQFFKRMNVFIDKNIKGFNVILSKPEIEAYLETEKSLLKAKIVCKYNNHEMQLMSEKRLINDTIFFVHDFEYNLYNEIMKIKPFRTGLVFYFTKEQAITFIGKILHEKFPEVKVFGEEKLVKFKILKPKKKILHIKTFSFNEWFGIDGWLDFEDLKVSLFDIVKSIRKGKNYVQIKKDVYATIPDKVIENVKKLLENPSIQYDSKKNELKSLKPELINFDEFLKDLSVEVEYSKELIELREKLINFRKIKKYKIPEPFNSLLRNYQKEGVWWLLFLRDYNLNGILADEMGLGKTIQALTLLSIEKKNRPNLIIVPTSLIFNWENEIKKYSYNFNYLIYYGKNRELELKNIHNFDIVLTTYNVARIDFEKLKDLEFNYIILDESQYIKNPTSIISKYLTKFKAKHKLALTGTPLENNLNELWSQFNFLLPGFLGDLASFLKEYSNKENLENLKKKIKPLILRRKKEDVLQELPPKNEIVHHYEMNEEQKQFYDAVRTFYLERIFKQIELVGINKSYNFIIEGLLRLRQICCHPVLSNFEYDNLSKIKSSKFENFKKLLISLVEKDRKILVYSQFVQMLKIMKKWLKTKGINYEYLDGHTKNRFEKVKNFQENNDIKVFLISIKAGGVGLNLTSADNVIIYDPWWNPAVENQAIDRTHRIGQTKKVFVYKLIMKDSIEEKVLHLQKNKKELFDDILEEGTSSIKKLTKEDLEYLFG